MRKYIIVLLLFYSCGFNLPAVEKCSVPLAINSKDIQNLEILNDIIFRYEDALKQLSIDAEPKGVEMPNDSNRYFYISPSSVYRVVSAADSATFERALQTLDISLKDKDGDARINDINFRPCDSLVRYEFLYRWCSRGNGKAHVYHQLLYNPKHVKQEKEEVHAINENWQYLISIEEDLGNGFP